MYYVGLALGQQCQRWAHWADVVPALPLGQVRTYLIIAVIARMFCQTDICGSRARLEDHEQGLQRDVGSYMSAH